MFVIHDKGTGDDLGYTPYADRSKRKPKRKSVERRSDVGQSHELSKVKTSCANASTDSAPSWARSKLRWLLLAREVRSLPPQYSQASAIKPFLLKIAPNQAAMDKRLADQKADVAAAEADGWEVKRLRRSLPSAGSSVHRLEVTHNGQRVKYGFSSKGEADDRMIRLHKAGVTRPKAEQNQATREELKAKGATSVAKAAEPEKRPS